MKISLKRASSLAQGKVYQASEERANGVCLKEKNQQEINYNTSKNISDDRKVEEHFQKSKKKPKLNKTTKPQKRKQLR